MLRNPSCGARKNPRALPALFLDFFDRCAHPYSLHRLRRARRRCPRRNRRSGSNPVLPHIKTKSSRPVGRLLFVLAQKEGFEVASQPLLRCPKKSFGRIRAFPRFFRPLRPPLLASSPSARSQALPTPKPALRFKSRFTANKNQKQPPFLTTAFCLGAEGGI